MAKSKLTLFRQKLYWCETKKLNRWRGEANGVKEVEEGFGVQRFIFYTLTSIGENNFSKFFKSDFKWHYICSEA